MEYGTWVDTKFVSMDYHDDRGKNDEYAGIIHPVTQPGNYEFTCRFRGDGGRTWKWSDLPNGNGKIKATSIGWAGNLWPDGDHPVSLSLTSKTTIFSEVWAEGITDKAGRGKTLLVRYIGALY